MCLIDFIILIFLALVVAVVFSALASSGLIWIPLIILAIIAAIVAPIIITAKKQQKEAETKAGKPNIVDDTYDQALNTSKDYLEYESLSSSGLKKYLEEDSYSEEQVAYAIDNCGVDWNEQAVRAAKEWLEYEPLSRKKLIEYLIDDGFTPEQAEYAANAIEKRQ